MAVIAMACMDNNIHESNQSRALISLLIEQCILAAELMIGSAMGTI